MTTSTTSPTAASGTWALFTHRTVTWREASYGWAVLVAAGASAVAAGLLIKVARFVVDSRG